MTTRAGPQAGKARVFVDGARFELTTGAVLSAFNTGTPPHTVVGVRVKK